MKLFRTPEFKTKRALLPSAIYFRDIRPLRITAQQASLALGAPKRSRTVQRLIYAATIGATKRDGTPWIIIAQQGARGRSTMIDTASLERAYHAMLEGRNRLSYLQKLKRVRNKEETAFRWRRWRWGRPRQ